MEIVITHHARIRVDERTAIYTIDVKYAVQKAFRRWTMGENWILHWETDAGALDAQFVVPLKAANRKVFVYCRWQVWDVIKVVTVIPVERKAKLELWKQLDRIRGAHHWPRCY